jgi:flagellar motor component MotA
MILENFNTIVLCILIGFLFMGDRMVTLLQLACIIMVGGFVIAASAALFFTGLRLLINYIRGK